MPAPSPLSEPMPLSLRLERQRAGVLQRLAECRVPGIEQGHAVAAVVALEMATVADLLAACDLEALVPELPGASPRRRRAFLAGRLCAEMALREASGASAHVARHADGDPVWPEGWCGAIAHGEHLAIAAVTPRSRANGLGIDVERCVDASARAAVEQVCSTPAERRAIAASAAPEAFATLVFSAKESYYKAVFPTIRAFVDFHEVELAEVDWRERRFLVRPTSARGSDGAALPSLRGTFQWLGADLVTQVSDPAAPHGIDAGRQVHGAAAAATT